MRITAFDLETTGPDPATARIVTFALVSMTPDGIDATIAGLVNPGVEIPEEATAVHGVTTSEAVEHGMHPLQALNQIMTLLAWGGPRTPVCAFNARFDLTVLAHELTRHGLATDLLHAVPVIDPLVLDRQFDKFRRGKRTLAAVSEHYGCPIGEDAHRADADAVAAGNVFHALQQRYGFLRNIDLRELHAVQVEWAAEQARSLEAHLRRTDPTASVEARWPIALDPVEATNA